jgi:Tfp pilus assembly protein PilE
MKNVKGITLIELIIFILVGGIFVPLAYVAFTSVLKESTTPETLVKARFVTEAKIEDITKEAYDTITLTSTAYVAVNTDSRFTDASYNGYQWKWEITDITFQDNTGTTPYSTTIVSTPQNSWVANTPYNLGTYVKPTNPNNHFYRVYFPKWQANTPYRNGNNIIPTTFHPTLNRHVYRLALNYPFWTSNTSYSPNSNVFPTTYNEFFYRVYVSQWQALNWYTIGDAVVSTDNQYVYRCSNCSWGSWCLSGVPPDPLLSGSSPVTDWGITWSRIQLQSGATQPPWDTQLWEGATFNDNNITWRAYSMRSGNSEPAWQTGIGSITADKNLLWFEDTSMRSSTTEPTWPTTAGTLIDDNSLTWVESNVYMLIKVYVRPPGCNSTLCEYVATSMVTGRNYTTRP